jgi:hypothetical protein
LYAHETSPFIIFEHASFLTSQTVHISDGINVGKMRWVEHVVRNVEKGNANKITVLELERNRSLGRPRR